MTRSIPSSTLGECGPSYWNETFSNVIVPPAPLASSISLDHFPSPFGEGGQRPDEVFSSFSNKCISPTRSRLILASCKSLVKAMNSFTGAFNWPMMYCTASIMPSVMLPFITANADMTVMIIFFDSFKNKLPASWTCWSVVPSTLILNSLACMRSHSHRLRVSQLFIFISLIPCTDCMRLLWLSLICWKRL